VSRICPVGGSRVIGRACSAPVQSSAWETCVCGVAPPRRTDDLAALLKPPDGAADSPVNAKGELSMRPCRIATISGARVASCRSSVSTGRSAPAFQVAWLFRGALDRAAFSALSCSLGVGARVEATPPACSPSRDIENGAHEAPRLT
jgi:hypothetical protein